MKFVKRPVVVEAFRFGYDSSPDWAAGLELNVYSDTGMAAAFIDTLEGRMRVNRGDYIIRGILGEFYPCKYDIFVQTYDKYQE